MATTLTLPLADVCKLLEENADRTAKRVASELEPVIAALSRKLEERSNDSERVYAALMTVLSGAQKVQFKIAYEATVRNLLRIYITSLTYSRGIRILDRSQRRHGARQHLKIPAMMRNRRLSCQSLGSSRGV